MHVDFIPYTLQFKFDAGTSRGVLKEKRTWFILIKEAGRIKGIGECGPLKGLSIDDREDFDKYLNDLCKRLNRVQTPSSFEDCLNLAYESVSPEFPSVRFGLETALLDLINGGKGVVFSNDFVAGKKSIPINGLIWMGKKEFMLEQIQRKIEEGYSCLKLKIGAIDFKQECELLGFIRSQFSEKELILRVDANGAFSFKEAVEKLKVLSEYCIHSVEQPIKHGHWQNMAELVKMNILPIALDEELIGLSDPNKRQELLDTIHPPYIILKPSLIGGIRSTQEWIELAEKRNIGWWITSALESNIGLNAIAQLTASYEIKIPQGLGTGQLYWNNIESPLEIKEGYLIYNLNKSFKYEDLSGK